MIKLSFSLWLLGKRFVCHYGRKFENFSILGVDFFFLKKRKVKLLYFGRVTSASSLSKGLNVLAIFKSVDKKIEVFSEGRARRKFFTSGFAFERLTFLSKVENRLKRGKNLCENFTRKDILNFRECLGDGNLCFLPFLFAGFVGHVF